MIFSISQESLLYVQIFLLTDIFWWTMLGKQIAFYSLSTQLYIHNRLTIGTYTNVLKNRHHCKKNIFKKEIGKLKNSTIMFYFLLLW